MLFFLLLHHLSVVPCFLTNLLNSMDCIECSHTEFFLDTYLKVRLELSPYRLETIKINFLLIARMMFLTKLNIRARI